MADDSCCAIEVCRGYRIYIYHLSIIFIIADMLKWMIPETKKRSHFLSLYYRLLIVTCVIFSVRIEAVANVLVCNANSYIHREFISEMYKNHPVERRWECDHVVEEEAKFAFEVAECQGLYLFVIAGGAGAGAVAGCVAAVVGLRNERIERCKFLEKLFDDQANNLNLRIPGNYHMPESRYLDYYVNISTAPSAKHEFLPRNSKTVSWRSFSLASGSVKDEIGCKTDEKSEIVGNCDYPMFKLPNSFFEKMMTVGSNTLMGEGGSSSLYPDVMFGEELQKSAGSVAGRFIKSKSTTVGGSQWSFMTHGCTAPYFKVRVKWSVSTTEPISGKSVKAGDTSRRRRRLLSSSSMSIGSSTNGGSEYFDDEPFQEMFGNKSHGNNHHIRHLLSAPQTYTCWKRTIMIQEVFDVGTEHMRCQMPYSSNALRGMLASPEMQPDPRANVLMKIEAHTWGISRDGSFSIPFNSLYASHLLECAEPVNQATSVGGSWGGFSDTTPGSCMPCASASLMQKNNLRTRACNRSNPVDAKRDCCFSCKVNYMISPSDSSSDIPVCIPACRPGQVYENSRCKLCESGKYSKGGMSPCKTCYDLGYPNSRVDPLRGCIYCGLRASAEATPLKCVPCGLGLIVPPPLGQQCVGCPSSGAYYLPESTSATACLACANGTYMNVGSSACMQCPQDTYNSREASRVCFPCPIGTHSLATRTSCLACAAINKTLLPFTEYFESGCRARCNPNISYLVSNPYSVGGCGMCKDVVLPVGTHSDSLDCSQPVRCTNAPLNAFYTGAAPSLTSVLCPWNCSPGYMISTGGGSCPACTYPPNTFNASKHQHTKGCSYTCKSHYYVNLATLACDEPCKDLIEESRNNLILSRVRDYHASIARPNYVLGVCGSTETVPKSEIPFLRLGRWAYISATIASTCGNSLLNTGEECDDGNARGGDGCSSLCKVETDQYYWDCDLIGSPCLPNCGWRVVNEDDWGVSLEGYVLPSCGRTCSCANLSYYDVARLPAGQRGTWMSSHLSSCGCDGNILRTVPYSECTVENKGCRMCASNYYHDDLLGACVACGSACLPGFTSYIGSFCTPSISTSDLGSFSIEDAQKYVGCEPCTIPTGLNAGQVRFIQDQPSISDSRCRFSCYKDTTGETTSQDTYCSKVTTTTTNVSDVRECTGHCFSCQAKLNLILQQESTQIGKYPQGCSDVVGYEWKDCDSDSKPQFSRFTGSSVIPGARTECEWECNADHILSMGLCVPCFPSTQSFAPCKSGEQTMSCDASSQTLACQTCDGPLPFAFQIWISNPPYFRECFPDCEPGIAWGPESGGLCTQCSPSLQCALGELYVPCTIRNDSYCDQCSNQNVLANGEYITGGSCMTRCQSGFFMNFNAITPMGQCEICQPLLSCRPEDGVRPTSLCIPPEERLKRPECVACGDSNGNNNNSLMLKSQERWSNFIPCTKICKFGAVRPFAENDTCVVCTPSLCGKGSFGSCVNTNNALNFFASTELICIPCGVVGVNAVYSVPGNCQTSCIENFVENESGVCVPIRVIIISPTPDSSNDNKNSDEPITMSYPVRGSRHSGMTS